MAADQTVSVCRRMVQMQNQAGKDVTLLEIIT
jgi:hypothetical protein